MKAKKHLGQHFLTSKKALRDMIASAHLQPDDVVLEIGPGKGVLTRALLETNVKVVAIETDPDMIAVLQESFATEIASGKLTLVESDILKIPLTTGTFKEWGVDQYHVIANIPYYITGEIIRRLLTAQMQPMSMTLLIQKEVAERIARSEKETVLSLSVKAYGQPRYVSTVPARYFNPPPKVDSAILHIANISKTFFSDLNEERFFKVVKQGFASKRKKLVNNLPAFANKAELIAVFHSLGLNENTRPEDVCLDEWRKLAQNL